MKTTSALNRRQFVKLAATTAGALALPSLLPAAETRRGPWKFCAFEKPLQFLNYDELAGFVAELGFDGIEATVRPGGHVLPERVEEDLPRLVEALKQRGLEITVMTSGINSVRQPHTEKVLRTAARLGVKRYRMQYWSYDLKKPVWLQVEALQPEVRDLAALNRELGISALYQNHAGANLVGATLWDLHHLLKDHSPAEIGVAFDIRHAQVEAGTAWPTLFQLVKSHVTTVYVKDFAWEGSRVKNVPLGEGRVDRQFFKLLKAAQYVGPISLHVEYLTAAAGRAALAEAFRKDFDTLRSWLAA